LTQSFVLESDDPGQLTDARDLLMEAYHIIPDVPFGLPRPVGRLEKVAAGDGDVTWFFPDVTGIPAAHEDGNRGAGVIVAILDSGCDADHDEFAGRLIDFLWVPLGAVEAARSVRGFDTVNHGTHVTGIIGGNRLGIAPEAEILVAAVIESELLTTSLSRIIQGLEWILQVVSRDDNQEKPAVLNMSLGFRHDWLAPTEITNTMVGIRLLLRQLLEFDVLPVVAIGNDGPATVRAPGYFPEVLSVGAVDFAQEPAGFSGGGAGPPPFEDSISPDLVGYGVEITSSLERDVPGRSYYARLSGTSMATPYVSGVAALVAAKTGLRGNDLRHHLERTAKELPFDPERVGKGLAVYDV
jgi:subtilisin family serine protease